jgi:pimeloyl-ACP methyl ester carboxylesterase
MRPSVIVLGVLLAGTLVTPAMAGAAPADPQWRPCDDLPLECTTLTVPLDYRAPAGAKIEIAVSRQKATGAARRGVLLLNPGGPGGPGLDQPLTVGQQAPRNLTDTYDLIGFDPRGTGRSAPISCELTPEQASPALGVPYAAPDGDITANIAYSQQVAKQCFEHAGTVLPFITTANTARDMDQIRIALGEEKISYLGSSYGTYLGAVYSNLFPARTDRFLLDSVVNPRQVWRDSWLAWGSGIEERFDDFAEWAAERDPTYELGESADQVRETYLNLAAKLDATPVNGWTGNLLRARTRVELFSDASFPGLAKLYGSVQRGDVEPFTPVADPQTQAIQATLWGIICGDAPWTTSVAEHQREVLSYKQKYPITNGMPANIWPCAFWPARPAEPAVQLNGSGGGTMLLTQNLRDPATPLVGAREMRRMLGDRARLVTADQGGHGAYLVTGNACLNNTATEFLVRGTLPVDDVTCG